MSFHTSELCDKYAESEHIQILEPIFKVYGAQSKFCGVITTLKVFEDNSLVKTTLEEKVLNGVLVIDGGGSKRCALVDEGLANLAFTNGWQGIIVYGCIRNAEAIKQLPFTLIALHTHPLASHKHGQGEKDILLTFAGVNFKKNHYLYADSDGVIVTERNLD